MTRLDERPAPIRALVVDDESLARRNLTVLLRRDPDVGEHGIRQTLCDDTDHALDRFVGTHELRCAAAFECKLLEKTHVDIGAQAESEDPPRR